MPHWEIAIFFALIAFIYASVGFGGGSSYLAILAVYALPFQEIRLIALVCNIIVVTGGTIHFIRNKKVNWRKILPLVCTSIPMAFLGAKMRLSQDVFFIILGCSLLLAASLLWIKTKQLKEDDLIAKPNYIKDVMLGGAIGFLSGMVGIGGGIFLSPILNISGWDSPRKIAATASVFILVNSISGIAGQLTHLPSEINFVRIAMLGGAVLIGGQLGSILGVNKFKQLTIKRTTSMLVFVAGLEVLLKHLHY